MMIHQIINYKNSSPNKLPMLIPNNCITNKLLTLNYRQFKLSKWKVKNG
jgi:hypothetical protein